MPKTEAQVLPREVRDAIEEVTRELLRILADAGINITAPNTKENRASFMEELKKEGIEMRKVISADRPDMSGTGVFKNDIQIGFIPALGVRGANGKGVIV